MYIYIYIYICIHTHVCIYIYMYQATYCSVRRDGFLICGFSVRPVRLLRVLISEGLTQADSQF